MFQGKNRLSYGVCQFLWCQCLHHADFKQPVRCPWAQSREGMRLVLRARRGCPCVGLPPPSLTAGFIRILILTSGRTLVFPLYTFQTLAAYRVAIPGIFFFQSLFMCCLTLFNEFLCISSQHVSSALYCDAEGPVSPPDFRAD